MRYHLNNIKIEYLWVYQNHISVLVGVGENCTINNAILDKNSRIGDNVTINGGSHVADTETETYVVKDGIVVIKKGAEIPKGFTIGV